MNTFKLEVNAMKTRQDKSDVLLRELREEIVQSSEDFGKSYSKHKTVSDNKLIDLRCERRVSSEILACSSNDNQYRIGEIPSHDFHLRSLPSHRKQIPNTPAHFSIIYRGRKLGIFLCLPSPFKNAFKYRGEGKRVMAIDYSERKSLAAKVSFSISFPWFFRPTWIDLLTCFKGIQLWFLFSSTFRQCRVAWLFSGKLCPAKRRE